VVLLFAAVAFLPFAQAQTLVDGVAVQINPTAVAVNPVTNKIYVANTGSGTVSVFDPNQHTVTNVTVGTSPVAVAVNPVTNKIYVANSASENVTVINGADNSKLVGHKSSDQQNLRRQWQFFGDGNQRCRQYHHSGGRKRQPWSWACGGEPGDQQDLRGRWK
jgi:YVTN family beta-propeller protein